MREPSVVHRRVVLEGVVVDSRDVPGRDFDGARAHLSFESGHGGGDLRIRMQMSAARAANGPARPHLTSRDRREGTRVRDHEDLGYREAAQAHTPCLGTIAKRLGRSNFSTLLGTSWLCTQL